MFSLRTQLLVLAVAMAGAGGLLAEGKKGLPQPSCKVAYQDLHLKIVTTGIVDVKDDHSVKCEVKAATRGGWSIKWIVANGSEVKKGDLLVEIDDSYLEEQAVQKKIDCLQAKSDLTATEATLPVRKEALAIAKLQGRPAEIKMVEADLKIAEAALESAREIVKLRESLHKNCLEQIRNCKIYAPRAGQVVRAVREDKGDGPEARQSMITRGDRVHNGQTLLTMPDFSVMAVQLRVNEGLIGFLRKGQSANVEIAGLKPLRAHVTEAACGADPKEERADLNVRFFPASLEFDEPVEELKHKRNARALCTIATDLRAAHVLAIPVRAVATSREKGKKPRCLVVTPGGLAEREVEVGLSDGRMVEVKAGLKEGESVVEDRR